MTGPVIAASAGVARENIGAGTWHLLHRFVLDPRGSVAGAGVLVRQFGMRL
jgi:hypothetical protein